jgi:hypothetical protein
MRLRLCEPLWHLLLAFVYYRSGIELGRDVQRAVAVICDQVVEYAFHCSIHAFTTDVKSEVAEHALIIYFLIESAVFLLVIYGRVYEVQYSMFLYLY